MLSAMCCVWRLKFRHQLAFFFFICELSSAGFISVKENGKLAVIDIFSGRIEVFGFSDSKIVRSRAVAI
jgi:hypothetical protein